MVMLLGTYAANEVTGEDGLIWLTVREQGRVVREVWLKDGVIIPPPQNVIDRLKRAEIEEVERLTRPAHSVSLMSRVRAALRR